MEAPHVIDGALFDLELGAGLDIAGGPGLARVVREEMLAEIEQTLDAWSRDLEGEMRLERLEVDLGTVVLDRSWDLARDSLARALRAALVEARPARPAPAPAGVADAAAPTAATPSSPGPGTPFEAYDLLDAVRARLAGEPPRVDDEASFERLATTYPMHVQRIVRELQSRALPVDTVAERLSAAELRALVEAIVSSNAAGQAGSASGFAESIRAFASRAGDARAFHADVLVRLVRGEVLDLEAIAEGATAPSPGPDSPATDTGEDGSGDARGLEGRAATDAGPAPAPHRALTELLASLLPDASAGAGARAADRLEAFERALDARDEDLGVALRRRLRDQAAVAALMGALPERLLAKVLRVLAPRTAGRHLVLADAVANAAHPLLASLSADRLAAVKWHHLLGAAVLDASRADEHGLVDGLVEELARLAGIGVESLRRGLARQVARDVLSAHRDAQLAVLASLDADELAALVDAVVALSEPADVAAPSPFRTAIAAFASRAADQHRYHAGILAGIARDEPVDLEALAAPSSATGTPPAQRAPTVARRPEPQRAGVARGAGARPEDAVASFAALEAVLRSDAPVSDAAGVRAAAAAERLLDETPAGFAEWSRAALADQGSVERLVALLPERLLARALHALWPAGYPRIQLAADLVATAAHGRGLELDVARIAEWKWRFALRYALEHGRAGDSGPGAAPEPPFARAFADHLAERAEAPDTVAFRAALARQLATNVLPAGREAQLDVLRAVTAEPAAAPRAVTAPTPAGEELAVIDAGQVLASPYLPLLFRRLDLLEGRVLRSPAHAALAVQALQHLVFGDAGGPEHPLALSRLLCGLGANESLAPGRALDDAARRLIDEMIGAMIARWRAVGNTSVAGLRESFLQRSGTLSRREEGWRLEVEARPFDMLLDRLPWGIGTIRHPWMDHLLTVRWR